MAYEVNEASDFCGKQNICCDPIGLLDVKGMFLYIDYTIEFLEYAVSLSLSQHILVSFLLGYENSRKS